jgi:PAS domain S-box-containing protein
LIAEIPTFCVPDSSEGAKPVGGSSVLGAGRGYLLAAVAVLAFFVLRLALDSWLGDRLPYGGFFLALLIVARFAGPGPQLAAGIAGLVLGNLLFIYPRNSLQIATGLYQINTALYCAVCALTMFLTARARRSVGRELAARERIAGILECTSDAVCTVNEKWDVTYLNKKATELTGMTPAAVLGREYWQVWPRMLGTSFERNCRRVMTDGQPVHFEERHPANQHWIEVHACRYASGIAIFFRDVSERKRAEASRAQLAAIVESSDDAIIAKSMDGLIVSWNAAAERLYGYPAAEAIGRSFAMLFPIERSHELLPLLDRVRRGERVNHLETAQRTSNGGTVDVSLTISPVQTSDGQNVGISITARDISERKRQESERERLIKELQAAMLEVKTLSGLLPICAKCKKIRDDKGYWNQIESFIGARSRARFSHGICPDCMLHLYPDLQ